MTERFRVELPLGLLPGSAAAAAWLSEALEKAFEADAEQVELDGAWMLSALPQHAGSLRELASEGRLRVGAQYCRLSVFTPPAFRKAADRVLELELDAMDAVETVPVTANEDELATLSEVAGQACEVQAAVDLLAPTLPELPVSFLREILPALSPAVLGAIGSASVQEHGLAILRDALVTLGLEDARMPLPKQRKKLPKRIPELALLAEGLELRWRRSRGLRWQTPSMPETDFVCALEVQGDLGDRGAFEPGHPERPRYFETGHMRPVLHAEQDGVSALALHRELRLPRDAGSTTPPYAHVGWRLTLRLEEEKGGVSSLFIEAELERPVPMQRYRLILPLPFYPRPGIYPIPDAEPLRVVEREGAAGPLPVLGNFSVAGPDDVLHVSGTGLREVECYERKNQHLLAVTLLRAGERAHTPSSVLRRYCVRFQRPGSR